MRVLLDTHTWLLFVVIAALAGCTNRAPESQTLPPAMIRVGQHWYEAAGVAQSAGFQVHEPLGLERLPQPQGFSLDLGHDRTLLVFLDVPHGTVIGLEWEENSSVSKIAQVFHPVESFDLHGPIPPR
jgi:hypothetical protein